MELTTLTEVIRLKNEDGETLLEAPLMELHHFCVLTMIEIQENVGEQSYVAIAKLQAAAINKEYQANIAWHHVVQITEYVNQRVEELKKKNSSVVAE